MSDGYRAAVEQLMHASDFGWKEWRRDTWGDAEDGPIDNIDLWNIFQGIQLRLDTIIYSLKYLWPNFVEIDGLILREEDQPWTVERLRDYRAQNSPLLPEQVEYLLNHLHLIELFRNSSAQGMPDESVWWYLAETVAEMWRCRLTQLFPDKRFHVEVYEGYGLEIWAWTIRDNDNGANSSSPSPLGTTNEPKHTGDGEGVGG